MYQAGCNCLADDTDMVREHNGHSVTLNEHGEFIQNVSSGITGQTTDWHG